MGARDVEKIDDQAVPSEETVCTVQQLLDIIEVVDQVGRRM